MATRSATTVRAGRIETGNGPGSDDGADAADATGSLSGEDFRRVTAACFRALSGDPDIEVAFGAETAHMTGQRARLPQPPKPATNPEQGRYRGEGDALAMRLRHHDARLHGRATPGGEVAPLLFDCLETARIQALGGRHMAGLRANLGAALETHYHRLGFHRLEERTESALPEVIRLLAREHLSGDAPPECARRQVDLWRPHLAEKLAAPLARLQELMHDQAAYGEASRALIRAMDIDLGESGEGEADADSDADQGADQDQQSRGDADAEQEADDARSQEAAGQESEDSAGEQGAEEQNPDPEEMAALTAPGDDKAGEADRLRHPEHDLANLAKEKFYHPFSEAFDEIVPAESLCDAEELTRLRLLLDQQLAHLQGVVGKLANRLQRRLMAKQTRAWIFDLEEGLLDTGRLSRVVANPSHPLSFKQESDSDFRDTIVTLLIDNSGSMRGRPISIAAMSADILTRTLERCGVKVEILGFTTRAWKGGQAREKWVAEGKPADPGRLNDLRHVLYKTADAPYRRARRNLGLMLREGLLKENIDGEALLWAHRRLLQRSEDRRILMVISDGAPVDDSTLSVNPGNYLERHLRDVIDGIENGSSVELTAIGIGHDVTRYYRRAVTLVDAEQLGGAMMEQLAELFEDESRLPRGRRRRALTPR